MAKAILKQFILSMNLKDEKSLLEKLDMFNSLDQKNIKITILSQKNGSSQIESRFAWVLEDRIAVDKIGVSFIRDSC
jgi:hypothetical protein